MFVLRKRVRKSPTGDVALTFGISEGTVNRYVASGLPHGREKRGSVYKNVFNLGEVKEWMADHGLNGQVGRHTSWR